MKKEGLKKKAMKTVKTAKRAEKKPRILTINRKVWLRGETSNKSALLRGKDQKKCCLGFYLSSLGVPPEHLLDNGTPAEVVCYKRFPKWGRWLLSNRENSRATDRLIDINDTEVNSYLDEANRTQLQSEKEREDLIRKEFAKHNVRVRFVD